MKFINTNVHVFCALAMVLSASLVSAASPAETFPARPIRMLVPYPPGGGLDLPGRAVSEKFAAQTGKQLVLDNRGGAGGLIAGEIVANAAPDGYTLILASNGQVSIPPALYQKLPYNPLTDLVPITHFVDTPMVLFTTANFPARSVKDVVTLASEKPGKIGCALSGVGGVSHLIMELFKQKSGAPLLGVPYKGAASAMTDLAAGDVPLIFSSFAAGKPLLDAGRIRALAVASKKRTSGMPSLPTFEELGFPGMDAPLWIGMMAPHGTPEPIIAKLHAEFAKALAQPDVQQRLASQSADVVASGPREFGEMIRADAARWKTVVKTAGIKIEQ